jgi:ribosomal protein L13E
VYILHLRATFPESGVIICTLEPRAEMTSGTKDFATQSLWEASNLLHPEMREEDMWNRRDWDDFFNNIVQKRWSTHRPPRPVDLSRRNRLTPAEGYSLAELDDAGLSIEQAEHLGLPVDAGRVGSYGPNVATLRAFIRSTRSRF